MDDVTTAASARTRERGRGGAAHVFETLRQEIIALTLAPGTVLSRAELQDRFGLSSTPVRDALMRLQEEGLVDVFPQHATVVSPIDLEKARQGQFLRRSVELEIVRTLALGRIARHQQDPHRGVILARLQGERDTRYRLIRGFY